MKLIFQHYWVDFTHSGTTIFPVEYSSKDDLLLDFEIACIEAHRNSKGLDFFQGRSLHLSDFMVTLDLKNGNVAYDPPTIYTLEEWLENNTAIPKTT